MSLHSCNTGVNRCLVIITTFCYSIFIESYDSNKQKGLACALVLTFGGILTTLTRNTAISRVREGNAQKRIPAELTVSIDDEASGMRQLASGDNTAEAAEALSGEAAAKAAITAFVRELPEGYKKIFVARYHYDAGVKEIANRLGIPSGTVKSTLHRLRKSLAEWLKKEGVEL